MLEGLSQDYQLTIPAILKRADELYGEREIVTRRPDKTFHRYTYADFVSRTKKLTVALKGLGVESGDRVVTLAWNTYQHLEAYFGVPCSGGVVHTLNPRLHEDDLAYIVNHAEDKVMMVDEPLLPVFEKFRENSETIEHVIVFNYGDEPVPDGMISYEELLEGADENDFEYPEFDERQAAALCYTSGTTGRPKGALYSHRGVVLHSMMSAMGNAFSLSDNDVVLPVVPMFHVNAWGIPYTATLTGSKQVLPGQHLDPASLIEDYEQEKVTFTAGVPTVFLAMLQTLDQEPGKHDLSALHSMVIGGAAAPKGVIKAYKERHGIEVIHAWGMTEMDPIGSVAHVTPEIKALPEEEQLEYKAKQGYPTPFVEVRARGDEGFVPWDGETMGELEVRGPSIIKSYFNTEEGDDKFSEGGWFRTGDIVTIDKYGFIKITDRDKDLVKSGGEWISSVELENALMAHPAVAQAAVIAIPHEKWDERPLAVIVLKEGESVTADDLREHLESDFAKFWLPDAYEFVEEIPQTATGKFLKMKLREQFQDYTLA
ncbi:MAG: Long-chain-fatty-acid--CoA ligase [uncultured Rubrobacteraceae bacterium]|uniref:Long-chain-fatty-acid--CoA ligase n=1 Tax=uncultured Rubrobacteraceae bacterium TaxID=349277 RepID=A0A6J4QZD0_9ACTN|nr:MAG: Long-chain-fatty-acid--CoA ligase [uncultured Rubrobacteraceae bacterium]